VLLPASSGKSNREEGKAAFVVDRLFSASYSGFAISLHPGPHVGLGADADALSGLPPRATVAAVERIRHTQDSQGQNPALTRAIFQAKVSIAFSVVPHSLGSGLSRPGGTSHRNVQRFRGGLVFKAHGLYVSLNSRLESNEERERPGGGADAGAPSDPPPHAASSGLRFRVQGSGFGGSQPEQRSRPLVLRVSGSGFHFSVKPCLASQEIPAEIPVELSVIGLRVMLVLHLYIVYRQVF